MPQNYYMVLTARGAEKKVQLDAQGAPLQLSQFAVGDGNGQYVAPDPTWTALTNEVYRHDLNNMYQDPDNLTYLVCEGYIPQDQGGFAIREVGIFDIDNELIMVGAYPETYKPGPGEGAARDLYIRAITEVSSTDNITISVDNTSVLATREYVDNRTQPASETVSGVIEIASFAETLQGTDHGRAVTPAGLASADALKLILDYLPHNKQETLVAADGAAGDHFGRSVALSADGNTALIGANGDDVGASDRQGSAFVFIRDSAGAWSQQAQLTAADGAAVDYFGISVALSADGNTALIGANGDDVGANSSQGSAYVFTRDGAGAWSQEAKLTAADGAAGDWFGNSVALSAAANTALIGANSDDVGATNWDQGSAYVFIREGDGAWSQQAKLTAADGAADDYFGSSVALSADGNAALIGAYRHDVGANGNQGSAYVFIRNGAGAWSQQAQLTAADGAAGDWFGSSVALAAGGNTALIGAYSDHVGANGDQGSAYVFTRDGAGAWSQQAQLTAADGAASDQFGTSVALSAGGNTALISACYRDVGANSNQGSAYAFTKTL